MTVRPDRVAPFSFSAQPLGPLHAITWYLPPWHSRMFDLSRQLASSPAQEPPAFFFGLQPLTAIEAMIRPVMTTATVFVIGVVWILELMGGRAYPRSHRSRHAMSHGYARRVSAPAEPDSRRPVAKQGTADQRSGRPQRKPMRGFCGTDAAALCLTAARRVDPPGSVHGLPRTLRRSDEAAVFSRQTGSIAGFTR